MLIMHMSQRRRSLIPGSTEIDKARGRAHLAWEDSRLGVVRRASKKVLLLRTTTRRGGGGGSARSGGVERAATFAAVPVELHGEAGRRRD